jgi:hypothetical protein
LTKHLDSEPIFNDEKVVKTTFDASLRSEDMVVTNGNPRRFFMVFLKWRSPIVGSGRDWRQVGLTFGIANHRATHSEVEYLAHITASLSLTSQYGSVNRPFRDSL